MSRVFKIDFKTDSHQLCGSHTPIYDNIFGEFRAVAKRTVYESQGRKAVATSFGVFSPCSFFRLAIFGRCFEIARQMQGSLKLPHDITRGEAMVDANYIVIRDFVSRRSQVSGTNNLR